MSPSPSIKPAAGSSATTAPSTALPTDLTAFDQLATMVAIVEPTGRCLYVNAAFEEVLGLSRRGIYGDSIYGWFVDAALLQDVVSAVARNEYATSRLHSELRRHIHVTSGDPLAVQVIVTRMDVEDQILIELVEVEQQTRQEREERALEQGQANKELIRNLAHEIKNPLGGIRGAAQLLQMELENKSLTEYTQVIIHEADRQTMGWAPGAWVDIQSWAEDGRHREARRRGVGPHHQHRHERGGEDPRRDGGAHGQGDPLQLVRPVAQGPARAGRHPRVPLG